MPHHDDLGGEPIGTPATSASGSEEGPSARRRATRRTAKSARAASDTERPGEPTDRAQPASGQVDHSDSGSGEDGAPAGESARAPRRAKATKAVKATKATKGGKAVKGAKAVKATKAAKSADEAGVAPEKVTPTAEPAVESALFELEPAPAPARRGRKRGSAAAAQMPDQAPAAPPVPSAEPPQAADAQPPSASPAPRASAEAGRPPTTAVFFIAPTEPAPAEGGERGAAEAAEPEGKPRRSRRSRRTSEPEPAVEAEPVVAEEPVAADEDQDEVDEEAEDGTGRRRRRRGRRGRGRGRGNADEAEAAEEPVTVDEGEDTEAEEEPLTRRRRRRRRSGAGGEAETTSDDGVVTVVKIRQPRAARDEVQGVTGSTRLEAKRQRRRDGREQRRTRPPILSESEFLARREAVDRVMVVRQKGDRTQVAVLEDNILVEHYVARQSAATMVGNVYLGKVQNVLPSMEAAFVDIGRGRNAVLYAGEVNWDASGLEGKARSIEQALKSGDSVLVQVTKDPIGHKGARLTSHIALSGRHLVYVPNGHASGISRKLPDVERRRLRDVLKNLVPDGAGVIVRTAAEGAAEDDLARDVKRLQSQWEDIQAKAASGHAPALLSAEPDLVIRVVRDLFNEDFREVVIQGHEAYEQVEEYLGQVSPDLVSRVRRHAGSGDAFAEWRIDEQILKGLDRKVYLPSGGHLVIDRTEAMTVVDVNTGKYTGAGGNLEETVTRNNLEAAEEIVRQLRLRDLGGIVVIDFIDMVLESNRELVLRRLTECLGRDRTKHQVTEITSLGLVQMTRKRIGQGLLEAFSETCEHCKGRGVLIHTEPVVVRNNVAEKVRAVAASTRTEAAPQGALSVEPDESAEPEAEQRLQPEEELDAAQQVADDVATVADELEPGLDSGAVASLEADLTDAAQDTSARRRSRRTSSRRRTRP